MIEFRVLGPLEVVDETRVLSLGGHKQRGVLALLLLERNRVVPRDRLVDALWGESPPASAANSVQVYISKLRRLLGDGGSGESALVTAPPGYLLRLAPGTLDADEFERLLVEGKSALRSESFAEAEMILANAVALWRGPALADLASEPFAQPEIARLEGLRLDALEARFEAMLAVGRESEAVGELQALVALHPLDERLRAQLMVALYRSGRHADALETYRAFRQILDEDLGLEPNPELRQLEHAILRQDESLGPVVRLAPATTMSAAPIPETLTAAAPQPRHMEDERRPVTVLFADIVGSTALGERLEPDEAKVLVGECVTMMSRAVDEYGGTRAGVPGRRDLCLLRRPGRTRGRSRARRPHRPSHPRGRERLRPRHRGCLGDLGLRGESRRQQRPGGGGARRELRPSGVALGDATNVAARLQASAEPGTILVGHVTARRLEHRFELGSSIEVSVKGTRRARPGLAPRSREGARATGLDDAGRRAGAGADRAPGSAP